MEIGREAIRELTEPGLTIFPLTWPARRPCSGVPDMVEAAANAAAGLIGPEALKTAIERLRRNPEIERLEPKKPTAESRAGMVHTEVYSTRHNLEAGTGGQGHDRGDDRRCTGHGPAGSRRSRRRWRPCWSRDIR